ncbi:MAG TPA: oxygenase MpaB family protein [Microlunatus sp.]
MVARPLDLPLLNRIRIRMAGAVASRLGGDDPQSAFSTLRAARDGVPWYPSDSPVRLVHGDIAMLVGGLRALLMQSLHPVAMQAVDEHSGYRSDPWARMQSTAAFIAITTFGTQDQAMAAISRVRNIHDHVSGMTPSGSPYRASDPHLLSWVHVAEADSFLTAHRLYGRTMLSPEQADRYVDDLARVAVALGAEEPPHTVDQLRSQFDAFRPELRGGGQARAATHLLLWNPPLTGAARMGYRLLTAGAVASLPPWARQELGLPSFPIMDRAMLRPAARALLSTLDRGFEAGFSKRPDAA